MAYWISMVVMTLLLLPLLLLVVVLFCCFKWCVRAKFVYIHLEMPIRKNELLLYVQMTERTIEKERKEEWLSKKKFNRVHERVRVSELWGRFGRLGFHFLFQRNPFMSDCACVSVWMFVRSTRHHSTTFERRLLVCTSSIHAQYLLKFYTSVLYKYI